MHYIGLLAGYLEYGLNKIAASVNNEVDIVREFVDFVSSDVAVKFNRISKNKYLSIKTRFVHQKPYAIFVNPQKICGKTRVELGDILFVVKHQRDGALIDHRGSFSQAKLYKSGWEIKAHQFEFLHNIRNITFRFGNKVYQDLKIQPINWDISSRSKWFSNFLLLSNIFSLSFPPNYFVNFYNRKCNNFYVNYWMSERSYRNLIQYYPRWSFRNFILNFLKRGGRGFRMNNELYDLVKMLYNLVGLHVDPPEEFKGFVEEDEKGFAVIEFKIIEERIR